MSTSPANPTSTSNLLTRQNEPEHLERLHAYSYRYLVAQRWRRARLAGTVLLAAVAPLIAWQSDRFVSDLLAAIAAGWLVVGRTVLQRFESDSYRRALVQQELYDVRLFGLSWNQGLCGREPNSADVLHDARRLNLARGRDRRYLDWFTVDVSGTTYPLDVLMWQRQALIWSRKDVRAYAAFLAAVTLVYLISVFALALYLDLSLAEFLVSLFLPAAPALLDVSELVRDHWHSAGAGDSIDDRAEQVVRAGRADPSKVTVDLCRSFQDEIFGRRSTSLRVPGWFYRLRRDGSHRLSSEAASR